MKRISLIAAGILLVPIASGLASADAPPQLGPGETFRQIYARPLPKLPGKSVIAVEVSYAPGGKSLPHRHAGSASIYAYIVSGAMRSQVAGEPVRVYRAGESFFEAPGSHHVLSENASKTEPAKLLAVFVVDTDDKVLTTPTNSAAKTALITAKRVPSCWQ